MSNSTPGSIGMRTKRRYAHELYPHPAEGEVRPLAVEVPYLYARAIGFDVQGTDWMDDKTPEGYRRSGDRTRAMVDARGWALLADALLQGLSGDEAWQWAELRNSPEGCEWVWQRAQHYGVDPGKIKPYPCNVEPGHHDHLGEPDRFVAGSHARSAQGVGLLGLLRAGMSDNSAIEWTDTTWNIATGCTKVSAGCDHCYIERTPPFRMQHRRFDKPGIGGTTGVLLHPERLTQPFRWRKSRRVFVNSLSDMMHRDVPDELIANMLAVIAVTPQHTYQLLTKRPDRLHSLLTNQSFIAMAHQMAALKAGLARNPPEMIRWPLPNLVGVVTVENQYWADRRIPVLLDTPLALRGLSCEPLLSAIDLHMPNRAEKSHPDIDWVIAGGESGPGARPMQAYWARTLRDQCSAAGVPFFFKQWGEYAPYSQLDAAGQAVARTRARTGFPPDCDDLIKVGKKAAGRLLDGQTWDEFPAVVPR